MCMRDLIVQKWRAKEKNRQHNYTQLFYEWIFFKFMMLCDEARRHEEGEEQAQWSS
jgi:hypothetical protein